MEGDTKPNPDSPSTEQIRVFPVSGPNSDAEKVVGAEDQRDVSTASPKQSAFKSLGWLDRFLAVWILLAMIIGILLGNFVPGTTDALQKGQFVGVSVPIGMSPPPSLSSPWVHSGIL